MIKEKDHILYLAGMNDQIAYRDMKSIILNVLFRNFSIVSNGKICRSLKSDSYKIIAIMTEIELSTVRKIIEKFLSDLTFLKIFLNNYTIKWEHEPKKLNRKVKSQLHKIYRLAPMFDYRRARINLEILQTTLKRKLFWPQIDTQIAIVIYVTDKNDKNIKNGKRILQKNLRALCNCSAYAFHRTRNKLNIN